MKTPPFLLGATLLFWGWQAHLPVIGALMALALESPRWLRVRWDFSDEDFSRIWTFCSLLLLAAAVVAFTSNEGPATFGGFFRNPNVTSSRNAGVVTSRAAAAWIRSTPMVFFLFIAAQVFSSRDGVPMRTISLILRLRWRKARKLGLPPPPDRVVNVSYPYFVLCLFAASTQPAEGSPFFWGLCVLLGWGLWVQRSRRFSPLSWGAALAVAIALGFLGQRGLGQFQHYLESFNPQWFTRFSRGDTDPVRNRTALGHIGVLQLSGNIVIRLTATSGTAPTYLREATYRTYKAQVWSSEISSNEFQVVPQQTNSNAFVLLPGDTKHSSANIACYLEGGSGLLPLPSGSGRLDSTFIFRLQKSALGAVLAEGPGLMIFDALYDKGETIDSPPAANHDLSASRETNALDQVISEMQVEGQSPEQKLRTLSTFFLTNFTYSIWQGPPGKGAPNETPLSRFLLRTRRGHCEYFATTGVLLLRRMGIPARYAVGYAVHEHSGRNYVVRQRDAHAWCLVWNATTRTWQDFDPTPPSWFEAEAARASRLQFLSDLWSWVRFQFSKLRWGQTHLREYLLWCLIPLLALLLYRIIFHSQRRRQRQQQRNLGLGAEWPGLDSEFYELEAMLVRRGMSRLPCEALSEWLGRAIEEPTLADLEALLRKLLRLHYRYRFDPLGLSPADRETLRRETRACVASLKQAKTYPSQIAG